MNIYDVHMYIYIYEHYICVFIRTYIYIYIYIYIHIRLSSCAFTMNSLFDITCVLCGIMAQW